LTPKDKSEIVRTLRNEMGIPIAAGILYPFTGLLPNPMIAGAAMALSSVSVISNARCRFRPRDQTLRFLCTAVVRLVSFNLVN
jgi:hypothetical protein